MTFEEFYPLLCEDNGIAVGGQYSEEIEDYCLLSFQAGAASRDAEVARLKTVPMKYRRMGFNAQLQNENAQLREQVAILLQWLEDAATTLETMHCDLAVTRATLTQCSKCADMPDQERALPVKHSPPLNQNHDLLPRPILLRRSRPLRSTRRRMLAPSD